MNLNEQERGWHKMFTGIVEEIGVSQINWLVFDINKTVLCYLSLKSLSTTLLKCEP